jgi:solute carrier family 25 carnitine/acylcarnitine transporter 20/29
MAQQTNSPLPQIVTTFLCGSMAGIASWACIYPVDIIKSKVQRNALAGSPYEQPWSIFRRLSAGGITRLYRGLGVSAVRSLFTHGLMCKV